MYCIWGNKIMFKLMINKCNAHLHWHVLFIQNLYI